MSEPWRPGASLADLHRAARLRKLVRDYFAAEGVLEVDTPALSAAGNPDPSIQSIAVNECANPTRWLHTSPEFAMKRLLAAYRTDIYQIAHVFRAGETGRFHNSEFMLLEWYRCGLDHCALIDDALALLASVWRGFDKAWLTPSMQAYGDLVESVAGVRPDALDVAAIAALFAAQRRCFPLDESDGVDAALDLLVDEFVLPTLPTDRISIIVDFPATQASLARLGRNSRGECVARRFELYLGQVELANGFHELTDAAEQRRRFLDDNARRAARGLPTMPIDEHLLAALEHGLPDCAGIALGLDRLLLGLCDASRLAEVMGFHDGNA